MNIFSISELRARGFSDVALFPEANLISAEAEVWNKVETFCLQFFEPRIFSDSSPGATYPAMRLNGSGRNSQALPVPVISIDSVSENNVVLDLEDVVVYNRFYPDDRRRPRLGHVDTRFFYTRGVHNIKIEGTFGFVEPNGKPPTDLQDAVMLMMLFELAPVVGKAGFKLPQQGLIIQENADKYLYKLQAGEVLNGVTGVPQIDKVLYKYRRGDDVLFGGVV